MFVVERPSNISVTLFFDRMFIISSKQCKQALFHLCILNMAAIHSGPQRGRSLHGFAYVFRQLQFPALRPNKRSCFGILAHLLLTPGTLSTLGSNPADTVFMLESSGLLNDPPRNTLHTEPVSREVVFRCCYFRRRRCCEFVLHLAVHIRRRRLYRPISVLR